MSNLQPTNPSDLATATADDRPRDAMGVVARLKTPPGKVKVEGTMDLSHGQTQLRRWVKITYSFRGKLFNFGKFLKQIAEDVYQAGGVVTGISVSPISSLSPANERPDDYSPFGDWRAMFVDFAIRTQVECEQDQAAWDAGVQEIVNRYHRDKAAEKTSKSK